MAFNGLRRALPHFTTVCRRSIMSSSWNAAMSQEDLEKNPYFDKYADKIRHLEMNNKEEFLARLKAKDENKKAADIKGIHVKDESPVEYPVPRKSGTFKKKELKDIMNIDLLLSKTPAEISTIWNEYYCSKEHVIFGSLSKDEFVGFVHLCNQYPVFVIPLPRGDGFEFFMAQFFLNEFHITPLILYHKYKEESPESLRVSYFPELPQDIVLFLGEYDDKVLSSIEAQCILNSLQLFYNSKERFEFVKKFNEHPQSFDYNELLREINSLSLQNQ